MCYVAHAEEGLGTRLGIYTNVKLTAIIINPQRACAARVTVLCVYLSVTVTHYSRTTGYEAAYERHQQLQCYKGKKINVAILLKRLRSKDMALKQANMHNALAYLDQV